MVASTYERRWPSLIEIGISIGLVLILLGCIGFVVGAPAYLGLGAKPQELPGEKKYAEGCVLLTEGKLEPAVTAFSKAIDDAPENATFYFKRADAYERLGKPDEAIANFTEGLRLDAGYVAGYRGRAAAYLEKGLPELAVDDLTEAIRLAPNSCEAVCLRACANLVLRRYAQAVEDAQAAIRLNGKFDDSFRTPAPSLPSPPDQELDRSVDYMVQAIHLDKTITTKVNPELATAYFAWGVTLDKAGKRQEAKKAFDASSERDPKTFAMLAAADQAQPNKGGIATNGKVPPGPDPMLVARYQHAVALAQVRQLDQARDELTSILKSDPKYAEAWRERGSVFLEKGDPDSAIRDFDQALRLDPDSAEAYCQRGQAYGMMGDTYQAVSDTTEAIHLRPDYALAYFHRADAFCKDKKFEFALASLDEAVRLDHYKASQRDRNLLLRAWALYVEIYQSQARANTAGQQWEKAVDSLLAIGSLREKLLSDTYWKDIPNPQLAEVNRQLAQAYQDLGKDRLAARHWDEAIASLVSALRSLEKATPFDKNELQRLCSLLAQAFCERGSDHANHGEFLDAVHDLNAAIDLDKYDAQTCRLCGVTCCKMARSYHDRGLIDREREMWIAAIGYLNLAIRLDPRLKYELQATLDDAQRNLDRISARGR